MASPAKTPLAMQLGLRPKSVSWLFISLGLVLAPHLGRLPFWILAFAVAFMFWRYMHERRGWPLPGGVLRLTLIILIMVGIVVTYGAPIQREPYVAFLVVLLGLKFIELRTRRDLFVVLFLGYFIVITHFLTRQSLVMTGYMLLVVWLLTTSLIHFSHRQDIGGKTVRSNSRLALIMLLQAIPIMAVMFVLFPRLANPLWGVPDSGGQATTGLSDNMSPGAISNLTQSDEVAFRATFKETLPAPDKRYWRGPVLWDYDGFTWSPGRPFISHPLRREVSGEAVEYTIIMEPSRKPWLLALDLPTEYITADNQRIILARNGLLPDRKQFTADYQLHAIGPVSDRTQYSLRSHLDYRTGEISAYMRRRALQLPDGIDETVFALARQLREENPGDKQLITAMLGYFNQQPFFYTLQPPLLGNQPVAEFLFDTRSGFCEHYASAFTVVMRAAGIPARVVTGYLGGDINPYGNYLQVRQSDAHAWAEVWLAGQGWVRYDPTAAVAPERITQGLDTLPEFSITPRILGQNTVFSELWLNAARRWDSVNHGWNRWVLSYDRNRQKRFLSQLGLDNENWLHIGIGIVVSISVLLLLFAGLMLLSSRHSDPAARWYEKYCKRLAGKGLARNDNEGPEDFARRVSQQYPQCAAQIKQITQSYINLRYGLASNRADLQQLKTSVRGLRI